MKKITATALIALGLCATLAGCGTPVTEGSDATGILDIVTVDGVTCAVYDSDGYAGGIDCNWEAYNNGN